MTIYLAAYLIPAISWLSMGLFNSQNRGVLGSAVMIAYCIFLVCFIGFRHEVSSDWSQYQTMFFVAGERRLSDVLQYLDPGFMFLCVIFAKAGFSFTALLVTCAAVAVLGLAALAVRTASPWLVFCVASSHFIVVMSMGHVRQSMALGLVMLGIAGLMRGSVTRYLFWCLLAATFHKSALVFLPMAGLVQDHHRAFFAAFAAVLAIAAFYVLVGESLDRYTDRYFERGYDAAGAAYRVLLNLVAALIFIFYSRRFEKDKVMERFWMLLSALAVALVALLIVSPSSAAVDRMGKYCLPLQFYVYGNMLRSMVNEVVLRVFVATGIVVLHGVYLYIWLQYSEMAQLYWVPYRSVLFQ